MSYNRETVNSASDTYNVSEINANDFIANCIFVPTDTPFTVTFDTAVDPDTISVFTNDAELPIDERNKKGSIQLSSIVSSSTGSDSDSLNLRAFKQTSKPDFTEVASGSTLAKDQTAGIEVEMLSMPEVSNANSTFSFQPVTNLSSNTVYFFNVISDAIDQDGNPVSFQVGNGFATDNSRSIILSSTPFKGKNISLPSTSSEKFIVGESIKKKDRLRPVAKVLEHEKSSSLTYDLDTSNYHINVAFSAASPCIITTNITHGLTSDNKITIYDIVSGEGLEKQTYEISSVTSDTITLDGINTSQGTAGRISFYVDFHAEDEIVSLRESDNIQIKAVSESTFVSANLELNTEFFQYLPTTTSQFGKVIRFDEDTLTMNYVPTEGRGSNIISSTDNFANNIILQQGDVKMFVRANTSPVQNVHPFDTSAPSVISFSPDADDSITRTLEVVEILRSGDTATVLTNSIHNLNIGDSITIEEADQLAYNKTTTVQSISSPFEFTYEVSDTPRSPATGDIVLKVGSTIQATAFQVQFSQSMNTSTITVANNTHIISANGTSAVFGGGESKSTSTIQLSHDNFANAENIVNCTSISANTGNSLFTIIPETLLRGKAYKIKVTTNAQDLGGTNTYQNYVTTNTFATGTKSINPLTGKEIIFVDNKSPKIKKISLGSLILESSNLSELTSPEDLDNLAVNLGSDSFSVQFDESMDISSVTVNTQNTDTFGTIQLSDDDFVSVVQMTTVDPTVSSTSETNDTFTFTPAHDLASNSNYILKITKSVSDDAPNQNFLVNDNVSSVKMMTVTGANGTLTTGEVIKGTRTMTVTSNTAAVTTGLTGGELILGTTSLAKGRIYDLTESGGKITTLRYTELVSDDGNVREFQPGEQVRALSTESLITLANSSITSAPEGTIVSHDFGANKVIYKEANSLNPFTAGSTSANDRVTGASSNVVAKTSVSTAITNSGISTTTTALTATAFMRKTDDSIVDVGAGAVTDIDFDSNVIIKFSQTMNTDTIIVNSTDTRVRSTDTVIFSADNNFGNCIPLMPNPTITENGSRFEFKPVILSNTSLSLTKGDRYDIKITRGAKTKGGSNTASDTTESYAQIVASAYFSRGAEVFDNSGQSVELEEGVTKTGISRSTPIIIHFSEVIDASTFASGSGNEIQLSTTSNFSSGFIACSLSRTGRFGTQISVIPDSTLAVDTYYLKLASGGQNEGGQNIAISYNLGQFTTA